MKHKGTKIIETKRLRLRPFTMADVDPVYHNWASDSEVTRYLTWPTHDSEQVTEMVISDWISQYDNLESYQWAIELKEIQEPIGSIGVVKFDSDIASVDVGYCMSKAWWGKEIMPEALRAVIAFFFEEVGMNRVAARHDRNNPKSGRVMEKAGMTYEGVQRMGGRNNQGIVDEVWYSILRSEYKKRG